MKPRSVGSDAEKLLVGLRDDVGARRFVPQRVRQKTILKGSGKVRSLGIPTVADRVVQASLKLVLEPIISWRISNHVPMVSAPSGGLRTLFAEIHFLGSSNRNYEWVFEGGYRGVLR